MREFFLKRDSHQYGFILTGPNNRLNPLFEIPFQRGLSGIFCREWAVRHPRSGKSLPGFLGFLSLPLDLAQLLQAVHRLQPIKRESFTGIAREMCSRDSGRLKNQNPSD